MVHVYGSSKIHAARVSGNNDSFCFWSDANGNGKVQVDGSACCYSDHAIFANCVAGFDYSINTTGVFMAADSCIGFTNSTSNYFDLWIVTLKCAWQNGYHAFQTFRSNGSGSVTNTDLTASRANRTFPYRGSENFAVTNQTKNLWGSYRTQNVSWQGWTGSS